MAKIEVENVNTPGKTTNVDADKYHAMRDALMIVMPKEPPGMPFNDIKELSKQHLPEALFPAGATSGWWGKCVQLDLEAKGIILRTKGSPLKFYLSNKV